MDNLKKIIVSLEDKDKRLDIFLSEKLNKPRAQIKKLIDTGFVLLNGKLPKKAGDQLNTGHIIKIKTFSQLENIPVLKKNGNKIFKKIKIIAETNDYLVVNKPAGLLVHPTLALEKNTLCEWFVRRCPEAENVGENKIRPGIVHRLDREASGLMVLAKNQKMFDFLKKQFHDRMVEKFYKVLVYGTFEKKYDKIDFEIDRAKNGKMVCRPKTDKLKLKNIKQLQKGKDSLTEFWVEKDFIRFSLLDVKIHTGRTHQIRVHMFASNHPVVGDNLYLNKKLIKKSDHKLSRLFLQSYKLNFFDLENNKIDLKIKLDPDLEKFLKNIK